MKSTTARFSLLPPTKATPGIARSRSAAHERVRIVPHRAPDHLRHLAVALARDGARIDDVRVAHALEGQYLHALSLQQLSDAFAFIEVDLAPQRADPGGEPE